MTNNKSEVKTYKDITVVWEACKKPACGSIQFSDETYGTDGKLYNRHNAVFNREDGNDILVGTWFKNRYWGKVLFQKSISSPPGIKSADLLIENCPFITGQTMEIKIIGSVRKDGLIKRLKQAYGQSDNVLIDISDYPYDLFTVKKELRKYYLSHDWLKLIAVKDKDRLLFVWQK